MITLAAVVAVVSFFSLGWYICREVAFSVMSPFRLVFLGSVPILLLSVRSLPHHINMRATSVFSFFLFVLSYPLVVVRSVA